MADILPQPLAPDQRRPSPAAGRSNGVIVALIVLCIGAVLYVVSLGPARWATQQGMMSHEAYLNIYAPLHWIGRHCEPLKAIGDRYLELWR